MPRAILIGFEYTFNALTGAIIDIYNGYTWCNTFGSKISILTDIEKMRDKEHRQTMIEQRISHDNINKFLDTNMIIVKNGKILEESIMIVLKGGIEDKKLIIYYSGHGVKDSMVMPDKTLYSFIKFRDLVLNNVNRDIEIFWILDCCNPNGMNLAYKLERNQYVLSGKKIEYVLQPILLITSSEAEEKSIATKYGSIFSRNLFMILTALNKKEIDKNTNVIPINKNRNLRRLIGNLASAIRKMHTGYAQTVSIYSSYVMDPILWMWIGSNKEYDIVADMSLSVLIIRNYKEEKEENGGMINPYDELYPEK